jgi:DnaJ like chaperone protein
MNYRDYFNQPSRFGKILGAILGFMMAGPIGAFLGLFIGNLFDKGLNEHLSKPHGSYRAEHRRQVKDKFIETTFSVMGHVAKVNGRVSEASIQTAKQIMQELGLNQAYIAAAQEFFNQGKQPGFPLSKILTEFQTIAYDTPELLKLFIEFQYRVAQADTLSSEKIAILNEIFTHMGLAPLHAQSRFYQDFADRHTYQRPQNHGTIGSLQEAYALLKLNPTASKEEVKKTYRKLMSQHHPDKMMSSQASEQAIKDANEKTQAIRRAYEQICAHQGW